jgi:gas vesicle protein
MKKVMKKKKGGISGGKVLLGVAALGAAGAGAYYLLGPKAKAHQKKASALFTKIKKEVEVEVKKAKEVGTPIYHKTVDMVSENYARQYQMHKPEIQAFAKKLKKEWKGAGKKTVKKPAKVSKKKKAK